MPVKTAVATDPPEDRKPVYAHIARILRAALSLKRRFAGDSADSYRGRPGDLDEEAR